MSPPRKVERARTRDWSLHAPRPELILLLVLAAVLNLWALDQNGWANEYYSAAVRSMSTSWHNFLYGSFDPSGVMTVDKPPLALWVQALSARAFGYHSLSILVPQALMGVGHRGRSSTTWCAGASAAWRASSAASCSRSRRSPSRCRATTTRTRCSCSAAPPRCGSWCARSRTAARAGSCWAGVMRRASASRRRWARRCWSCRASPPRGCGSRRAGGSPPLRQLLAGGAAMVVVGGAWPLLMALTPAADRPWISGTRDNSIWSLIFGYNGFGRLDGQAGGPAGAGGPGGGGAAASSAAPPASFRLFNDALGGQAGWLLGVGARGRRRHPRGIAAAARRRAHRLADRHRRRVPHHRGRVQLRQGHLPPLLRLAAGAVRGRAGRRHGRARAVAASAARGSSAPLAIAGGVVTELMVLHNLPGELGWLRPLLVVGTLIGAALLADGHASPRARGDRSPRRCSCC